MKKKYICSLLVISLILTLFLFSDVNAYALTNSALNNDYIANESQSENAYGKIIDYFKKDYKVNNFTLEPYTEENYIDFPDNYGGSFIDSNGILNIEIIGNTSTSNVNFDNITGLSKINYIQVKNPIKELYRIFFNLSDNMVNCNIISVNLDQINNIVDVGLSDLKTENSIKDKILKDYPDINFSCILFEKDDMKISASDSIKGGTCPIYNFINNNVEYGTAGYSATDSSGTAGLVSVGHFINIGNSPTYLGTTIGTCTKSQVFGTVDGSFTPYGSNFSKTYNINSSTYSSCIITSVATFMNYGVGASVTKFGGNSSDRTGTISSSNCSVLFLHNGSYVTLTNVVQASYYTELGDSGSPIGNITSSNWPFSANIMLSGIQSCIGQDENKNWVCSYYIKVGSIDGTFNITPYIYK
jgi:hypothetical protein